MININQKLLKTAKSAAFESGALLKEGFGTSFNISNKQGKNNLVTEYDTRSEELIIKKISKEFPSHSFLAEESGLRSSVDESEILWVIDPLDGTVNFAHSLPIFCVSIAAIQGNDILVGIIYNPMLDELFWTSKGEGAYLNNYKLNVSLVDDIDKSFLITGFPYNVDKNPCGCIDHFVDIIKRGIPVRRLGSAALDLAYVAAGRFDGFWEINLNPWDVAAGILLVREAGGRVTQYNELEYHLNNDSILATNGLIHSSISKVLGKCKCGASLEY